jgi:hypothetical protein
MAHQDYFWHRSKRLGVEDMNGRKKPGKTAWTRMAALDMSLAEVPTVDQGFWGVALTTNRALKHLTTRYQTC